MDGLLVCVRADVTEFARLMRRSKHMRGASDGE